MSLTNISGMSDTTKMMLFVFLGLIFAILVLGYHKSPQRSFSKTPSPSSTPEFSSGITSTGTNHPYGE